MAARGAETTELDILEQDTQRDTLSVSQKMPKNICKSSLSRDKSSDGTREASNVRTDIITTEISNEITDKVHEISSNRRRRKQTKPQRCNRLLQQPLLNSDSTSNSQVDHRGGNDQLGTNTKIGDIPPSVNLPRSITPPSIFQDHYQFKSKQTKHGFHIKRLHRPFYLKESMGFIQSKWAHQCSHCGQKFALADSLKKHIKRKHTVNKIHRCSFCGKQYTLTDSLRKHIKRDHCGERYHCVKCDKYLTSKANLKQHWRIHTGEKPYRCNQCEASFRYRHHLTQHIRIHNGVIETCEICGKQYNRRDSLTKHIKECHSNERKGEETVSDPLGDNEDEVIVRPQRDDKLTEQSNQTLSESIGIQDPSFVDKPINRKHTIKIHKCSFCGKQFTLTDSLRKHIKRKHTKRDHCGERYHCVKCDKYLSTKANLEQHWRIHTGEKPYRCNQCEAVFRYRHHLTQHIRIHNGVIETCEICGKQYNRRDSLTKHIKECHSDERKGETASDHLGEDEVIIRPQRDDKLTEQSNQNLSESIGIQDPSFVDSRKTFSCRQCDLYFPLRRTLLRHMQRRHKKVILACPICNQQYHLRDSLRKHVKSAHGVKLTDNRCSEDQLQYQPMMQKPDLKEIPDGKRDNAGNKPNSVKVKDSAEIHAVSHHPTVSNSRSGAVHAGKTRHACQHCGKCYSLRDSLNKHIKRSHPGIYWRKKEMKYVDKLSKALMMGSNNELVPDNLSESKRTEIEPGIDTTNHSYNPCNETLNKQLKILPEPNVENLMHQPVSCHSCPFCTEQYAHRDALSNHIRCSHPPVAYQQLFGELDNQRVNNDKSDLVNESYQCNDNGSNDYFGQNVFPSDEGSLDDYQCIDKGESKNFCNEGLIHNASTQGVFTCSTCNLVFNKSEAFESHITKHPTCSCCNKQYILRDSLRKHIMRTHPVYYAEMMSMRKQEKPLYRIGSVVTGQSSQSLDGWVCTACALIFDNQEDLTQHARIHPTCPYCGQQYTLQGSMRKHIKRKHPEFYKRKFDRSAVTDETVQAVQSSGRFSCSLCDISFERRQDLVIHGKHHPSCPCCNKQFSVQDDVIQHIKLKHSTFYRLHGRVEISTDTGMSTQGLEGTAESGLRDKEMESYNSAQHAIENSNGNDLQDSFTCAVCKITYNNQIDLTDHVNCHPTCSYCFKQYALRNSLSKHIKRSHQHQAAVSKECPSPTKLLKCSACKATFESQRDLDSHEKHHPSCRHCAKLYHSKTSLRIHLRDEHSDVSADQFNDRTMSVDGSAECIDQFGDKVMSMKTAQCSEGLKPSVVRTGYTEQSDSVAMSQEAQTKCLQRNEGAIQIKEEPREDYDKGAMQVGAEKDYTLQVGEGAKLMKVEADYEDQSNEGPTSGTTETSYTDESNEVLPIKVDMEYLSNDEEATCNEAETACPDSTINERPASVKTVTDSTKQSKESPAKVETEEDEEAILTESKIECMSNERPMSAKMDITDISDKSKALPVMTETEDTSNGRAISDTANINIDAADKSNNPFDETLLDIQVKRSHKASVDIKNEPGDYPEMSDIIMEEITPYNSDTTFRTETEGVNPELMEQDIEIEQNATDNANAATSQHIIFTCSACFLIFYDQESLDRHSRTHPMCPYCGRYYNLRDSLRKHLKRSHPVEYSKSRTDKSSPSPSKQWEYTLADEAKSSAEHPCSVCFFVFDCKESLDNHKNSHPACRYCGKLYRLKASLQKHVQRTHPEEYTKNKTRDGFQDENRDVSNHDYKLVKLRDKLQDNCVVGECEPMSKGYIVNQCNTFNDSIRSCGDKKIVDGVINAGPSVETNKSVDDNMFNHHDDASPTRKVFPCTLCLQMFDDQESLTLHSRMTHLACRYCDKTYNLADSLRKHIKRMHPEEKAKSNSQLSQEFVVNRFSRVVAEMPSPVADIPSPIAELPSAVVEMARVDVDGMSSMEMLANVSSDVLKMEENKQPTPLGVVYPCPACTIIFDNKEDLFVHAGSHPTCPICGRLYRVRNSLMKHIQRQHPEEYAKQKTGGVRLLK